MKNFIQALLFVLPQFALALNIYSVQVTPTGSQSVNVSLNTQAVELYYYDSWNYSITGNVITLDAFFIEGFGSTIAYLNNNFTIPNLSNQQYILAVRVFYTNATHNFKQLKDSRKLTFGLLTRKSEPVCPVILSPNPTTGDIFLSEPASEVVIFDMAGRKIKTFLQSQQLNLETLQDGIYLVRIDNCPYIQKIWLRQQ